MQKIINAYKFARSISRWNKSNGVRIGFPAVGYLVAVYVLTRDKERVTVADVETRTAGSIIKKTTNNNIKGNLNKLSERGYLNRQVEEYRKREVSYYSLSISGINLLNDLERMTKAARPLRPIK